jgi:hypothetical protein
VIAAAGIALLVALAAPVATPVAQQAASCPNATGVTVVVDFQELGGGVNVVCAPGPVASGLEAMRVAGVAYQTAQRFPGFVCRIAGQPANDPCVNASPASAYWSYWIAAPGGSWCYSTFGAGSRRPPAGTFEGWSFALDRTAAELPPPRFDPPPVPAGAAPITLNASDCTSTPQPPASSAPTATPTVPTTPAPLPPTTAATSLSTTPAATSTAPDSTVAASTTPEPEPTAVETSVATTTTTTRADEAVAAGTVDLGEDGGGGGSAIGFAASAAVVVGLGTAAALIARRHRLRGGA